MLMLAKIFSKQCHLKNIFSKPYHLFFLGSYAFQCLGFTAELERDFVKKDLGPALHNSGFKNVSLMIIDDQRLFVSYWAQIILGDPDAKKYISGLLCYFQSN